MWITQKRIIALKKFKKTDQILKIFSRQKIEVIYKFNLQEKKREIPLTTEVDISVNVFNKKTLQAINKKKIENNLYKSNQN